MNEPLNLQSGRFVSRVEDTAEVRLRALEVYLADLTAELEYLLGEINAALRSGESAQDVHE